MLQLKQITEKQIFYGIAIFLMVLMPVLSLKSGISGDEETYHYPHGKNVFNYYATLGKDTACLHYDNSVLHMYGPVFDLVTVIAVKVFKPDDEYLVRHVINSLAGWAGILFAALIAVMLGGWRAGILTLIFMFLSPRYLGHSFNNPKDIPFAAAYIFTIYAIIRFLKYYPDKIFRNGWLISLGIGLTIGVRVGGILLGIYFIFFAGLYYILTTQWKEWLKKDHLQKLWKLLFQAIIITLAGYIIGVILWPYSHKSPINNTIEAMKYMEQYATNLRQLFEGKIIWSDNVPNYYLPKYILITIPEFIIAGFLLFFILYKKLLKQNTLWYLILLFVSVFPVAYIIYKGSNVYGGWRHVLFVYPAIAIIASLGMNNLFHSINNRYFRWISTAIVLALLILPLKHTIANHPHEYIYYNSLVGGTKKAYGKYEMDYFYHSLRAGAEWLIKEKIHNADVPEGRKITVASNLSINTMHDFRNLKDKVRVIYIRYYQRGNTDWDYAIIANSYINPYQLNKNIWPPSNTIETIKVDGVPVCAILERKDRSDLRGHQLMNSGLAAQAIPWFKLAIKNDSKYELAYLNLANVYLSTGNNDSAIIAASSCLKYYPNYDLALNTLGMAYMNLGRSEDAFKVFKKNMSKNPKNVVSYYYCGLIYAQIQDYETALKYLDKAIKVNASYKPSYILLAQIYQLQGKTDAAKKVMDYVRSIR